MSATTEIPVTSGKSFYLGPTICYSVLLVLQFIGWFGESGVSHGYLILAMLITVTHVLCAFTLPLDRLTMAFWLSCGLWLWGIWMCVAYAHAYPSTWFFIGAGVCLMLMYEGYAKLLNQSGCTRLRENVFPRFFMAGKMKTAAAFRNAGQSSASNQSGAITRAVKQTVTFASIYGMEEEKKRIKLAAQEIIQASKARGQARNGILLIGDPGNGKTALAKALAGELNVPFVEITNGLVASQWINETTVNLMRGLNEARQKAPCVLLIDEIDSFLGDRSSAQRSDTEDGKIVNTLLTELVNLRSSGVIIVAATNHVKKLDSAGIREGRFDYKIEVLPPDENARKSILGDALRKALGNTPVQDGAVATVAKRWNGFSVVRILSIVKEIESAHRSKPYSIVTAADIFAALRTIQGTLGLPVDNAKGIANMLLPAALKEDLKSIVYRMRHIQQIEEAGGSLPTGLIFYGADPGTGKTECARSLAKDSGWAFLATTSNDLIADSGLIDKLYAEALSIRPCIIFIDEANDVLKDRSYSHYGALTNKILTVMDGVASERRDVMFIAATNYIDQVDPAVLRGGRISEKYHFTVPDIADQVTFIAKLIAGSKSKFSDEVSPEAIVLLMAEHELAGTVANIGAIMQDAVNSMLSKAASSGTVSMADIQRAILRQTV